MAYSLSRALSAAALRWTTRITNPRELAEHSVGSSCRPRCVQGTARLGAARSRSYCVRACHHALPFRGL